MPLDDFDSSGELQEAKLPQRKPQKPDLQMSQGFNKYDLSALGSSHTKRSSPFINATLEQDLDINTVEASKHKTLPRAEIKSESENDLKAGSENESSRVSCDSVTAKVPASDDAGSSIILPSRELAAAGQNVENLFQIFKISEDVNIKYEKQDDSVIAPEGKPPTTRVMSGLQKDVFLDNMKESTNPSEGSGSSCAESESTGTNGGGKKHRRRSMCYSGGQSFNSEKNGNSKPPYLVSSPVEIGLENSELYKDLSDSIEQTFQRTSRETKVRRSTRLQKDLEEEGLVWISLPFPSASCTSQRMKRRTICTVDSRGLESVALCKDPRSSGHTPSTAPPVSGKDREGLAASAASLPGRRRKSLWTSAPVNVKGPILAKCCKRRSSLPQSGESSLRDIQGVGHVGN